MLCYGKCLLTKETEQRTEKMANDFLHLLLLILILHPPKLSILNLFEKKKDEF